MHANDALCVVDEDVCYMAPTSRATRMPLQVNNVNDAPRVVGENLTTFEARVQARCPEPSTL